MARKITAIRTYRPEIERGKTHQMPWNCRMLFQNIVWYLAGGLSNNDEIHFRGTDGFVLRPKDGKIYALRKSLDFGDRIQNIAHAFTRISMRHRSNNRFRVVYEIETDNLFIQDNLQ